MANILPEQHKKRILKEYRLRLSSMLILLLASVFFLAAILKFPQWLITRLEIRSLNNEIERIDATYSELGTAENPQDKIKQVNTKLNILNDSQSSTLITAALEELVRRQVAGVRYTNISFDQVSGDSENGDDEMSVKLRLSGIVSNRSQLIELRDALESAELIRSVELPISNLAQTANAPFSLVITLNKGN